MGARERLILSDAQWARVCEHIIGGGRSCGTSGRDDRMSVEAALRIARTGSPWRDLPEAFGNRNSAFRRFGRRSARSVRHRVFAAVADNPDFEYLIVDGTIVRAHRHAAGAERGLAIGPSAAPAAA